MNPLRPIRVAALALMLVSGTAADLGAQGIVEPFMPTSSAECEKVSQDYVDLMRQIRTEISACSRNAVLRTGQTFVTVGSTGCSTTTYRQCIHLVAQCDAAAAQYSGAAHRCMMRLQAYLLTQQVAKPAGRVALLEAVTPAEEDISARAPSGLMTRREFVTSAITAASAAQLAAGTAGAMAGADQPGGAMAVYEATAADAGLVGGMVLPGASTRMIFLQSLANIEDQHKTAIERLERSVAAFEATIQPARPAFQPVAPAPTRLIGDGVPDDPDGEAYAAEDDYGHSADEDYAEYEDSYEEPDEAEPDSKPCDWMGWEDPNDPGNLPEDCEADGDDLVER